MVNPRMPPKSLVSDMSSSATNSEFRTNVGCCTLLLVNTGMQGVNVVLGSEASSSGAHSKQSAEHPSCGIRS
eukprot:804528-Rhodomonas_salina.2